MSKREIEDAEVANGRQAVSENGYGSKKSRKENRKQADETASAKGTPVMNGAGKEETKEEGRERKRLKKLAKETQQNAETEKTPLLNTASDSQKCEDKAARKAEKARLRALKKAERERKTESTGDVDTTATTTTTTTSTTTSTSSPAPSNPSSTLYTENASLTALPQAEIDSFLVDHFITITDPKSATLRPLTSFSYLPITEPAHLTPFKTFAAPTPIQAASWPFLFSGRDVIGVAETGSGKTMAFAVPCVRAISSLPKNQRNKGPRAVIVSPTRELAMQSHEQIMNLARASGLQAVCVYGGVPKDEQRKALKTADIVVATPGRLNDLINEGYADLTKAKYVVLDEADRMLDKGFEEEIRKIINTTPSLGNRQTLMFTATWPESVRALAATFMTTPVRINIGDNPTGDLRANTRIIQKVEVVDPRDKEYRLIQLLKQYQSGNQKDDKILVFCLYKKEATRVEGFIRSKGFRVAGIHGDLSQEQRTRSLEAFKKGNTPVLVATDVAARGLDIPAVKLVINCTVRILETW